MKRAFSLNAFRSVSLRRPFLLSVRVLFSLILTTVLVSPLPAKNPQTVAPQPLALLQQSLSGLTGSQTITDATLTGTAHRIAGADDETGTATLKVIAGASRVDLALSSGQWSEVLNTSAATPVGKWSGPDGTAHPIALHNLLIGPSWFFPTFAISGSISSSGAAATFVGNETHNGQSVQHFSIAQASSPAFSLDASSIAHLTQLDIFLDTTTLLPAALTFNTHPDNNFLLDIPVEIRFSDYRNVNGSQIPFHVQKYLNNSLVLDLQFQSATMNSGISTSDFQI